MFHLATLGSAFALDVHDVVGSFTAGKHADFVILDLDSTALLQRRMKQCSSLSERLFALATLADDRAVWETFVNGTCVYSRLQDHHNE